MTLSYGTNNGFIFWLFFISSLRSILHPLRPCSVPWEAEHEDGFQLDFLTLWLMVGFGQWELPIGNGKVEGETGWGIYSFAFSLTWEVCAVAVSPTSIASIGKPLTPLSPSQAQGHIISSPLLQAEEGNSYCCGWSLMPVSPNSLFIITLQPFGVSPDPGGPWL